MPFEERLLDSGGTIYASKDFWDPLVGRRLIWGHVSDGGGNAFTLREVSWDAGLQQLAYAPLREISSLREAELTAVGVTALNASVPLRRGPWRGPLQLEAQV